MQVESAHVHLLLHHLVTDPQKRLDTVESGLASVRFHVLGSLVRCRLHHPDYLAHHVALIAADHGLSAESTPRHHHSRIHVVVFAHLIASRKDLAIDRVVDPSNRHAVQVLGLDGKLLDAVEPVPSARGKLVGDERLQGLHSRVDQLVLHSFLAIEAIAHIVHSSSFVSASDNSRLSGHCVVS